MASRRQIGVFGIGAIGSVVAYHLGCNHHNQLYHFNRSVRTALSLILPDGQTIDQPIRALAVSDSPVLDWLFVCLKAHQIAAALPDLQHLTSPQTKLIIIRNGLYHGADFAHFCPPEQLLPVLINCPTQLNKNGYYEQLQVALLTAPDTGLGSDLVCLLALTKLQLALTEDFKTASWLKLTESAALGAITCLTGEGCWIFEDSRILGFYQNLLEETATVAIADGAHLPTNFVADLLHKVLQYPPHKGSSMLADRRAGKPLELTAKNGIITELARQYGIATPWNDLMCALLHHYFLCN